MKPIQAHLLPPQALIFPLIINPDQKFLTTYLIIIYKRIDKVSVL